MRLSSGSRRRGQPLVALAFLLLGWGAIRTALWAGSGEAPGPSVIQAAAAPVAKAGPAGDDARQPAERDAGGRRVRIVPIESVPRPVTIVPLEPVVSPSSAAPTPLPPRIAAAHQLLFLSATASLPPPPRALAAQARQAAAPVVPLLLAGQFHARRWSADGWLLWREGGNGFNLPGAGLSGAGLTSGAYGASQAGLVLRFHPKLASAHRPALFIKASAGLNKPRGEELAAGFALRPLPKVPLAAAGEVRVAQTPGGQVVRPGLAFVSEFPPVQLPLGMRGEASGQVGWVGGKDDSLFVDGQVRVDKPLVRSGQGELRLGAGAWGGAQEGASRLDAGPTASLNLPVSGINARLSVDYRFRVAGSAAPGSGVAVTFSAGF